MKFSEQYSVFLRSDLPPGERELLLKLCSRVITAAFNSELLLFICTEIDVSHGRYIEMQTFQPGDDLLRTIRVPHEFVFLISGSEDRAAIGFI